MSYMDEKGVYCKGCKKMIVEIVNGMGYALPGYAEMEMLFDDRSKHVTPMCGKCVSSELDLDAIYAEDLAQWGKELKGTGRSINTQTNSRKPVGKRINKEIKMDNSKRGGRRTLT